jgi:hypothetical protein
MIAPTLTPRSRRCKLCNSVAKIEDVTVRLFDREGKRLPAREAIAYVVSIGLDGSASSVRRWVDAHAQHVQRDMENPPALIEPGALAPVVPAGGDPGWVSVTEQGIAVGMDALSLIKTRMKDMEDKDLIQVAKMGQTAASKWGDWEAKGRKLNQMDALLKIASGFTRSPEQTA